MAQSIAYTAPTRDPRAELQERLENAPAEHAAALLSAYEVLQGLHDRGVLDLMRGALGSSDEVIEIAVDAAKSPAAIRGIRNLMLLVDVLGAIEPAQLKSIAQAAPAIVSALSEEREAPGPLRLAQESIGNRDFRRGLGATVAALQLLGARLAGKPSQD